MAEVVIDESLEIGRGVGESKGHDQGFEKAIAGPEGSLSLFPLCHANEVVGGTDVESGEELGTGQAHESFLDEGQWYRVIDGPFVEGREPSDFLTNKTGDAAGRASGGRNSWSGSLPATTSRFLARHGTSSRAACETSLRGIRWP